jgi:hypothetical protein
MFRYSLSNWLESRFSKTFLIRGASSEMSFCAINHPDLEPPDTLKLLVAGSEDQLSKKKPSDRYTELLARALGLGSGTTAVTTVAEVVRRMQFVLTPEIAMKLLLINERKV